MPNASLRAQLADLLGREPESDGPTRPTLARAALVCTRGSVVAARDGSEWVALVRSQEGQLYVVPDRCPHDGGLLSDGYVDGDKLVCARHGWEFDLVSGAGRGPCRLETRAYSLPRRNQGRLDES